jgi:two-component system CheB/CheR fusion protein
MTANGLAFSSTSAPMPLIIDGDTSRLHQVCVNLLTNAAKYTPHGGSVSLEALRDGDTAVVRVHDNGTGIPTDMLESIFELFVQSGRTLDRAQGGIGVGLTLARSLVEMHGGSLVARSAGEGHGSTFEVRIPLSAKLASEVRGSQPMPAARGGGRIMVVEDNVDAREMLCDLLSRAGFDCRAVGDGLAALEMMMSFRPDAAIIDVGLPGIDGFELARRIRGDSRLPPVTLIAVTGYGQMSDRQNAMSAGFDAHLIKPVKLDQIAELLRVS